MATVNPTQLFEMLGRAVAECQVLTKEAGEKDGQIKQYADALAAQRDEIATLTDEVNRLTPLVPKRRRGG